MYKFIMSYSRRESRKVDKKILKEAKKLGLKIGRVTDDSFS